VPVQGSGEPEAQHKVRGCWARLQVVVLVGLLPDRSKVEDPATGYRYKRIWLALCASRVIVRDFVCWCGSEHYSLPQVSKGCSWAVDAHLLAIARILELQISPV
jgi:hypothetical protein